MFVSRPLVRLFDQLRKRWVNSLSFFTGRGEEDGRDNLLGRKIEPMKERIGLTNWLAMPLVNRQEVNQQAVR